MLQFRVIFVVLFLAVIYQLSNDNESNEISSKYERHVKSVWLNANEVAKSVNYTNPLISTYEEFEEPYTIEYDRLTSCYIVFTDDSKENYRSINSKEDLRETNSLAYLHHHGPCGVCSNLADFAVYASNNNLMSRVRGCSLKFWQDKRKCIENIGFSSLCSAVWFWNTENTKNKCGLVCLKTLILQTPVNVLRDGYDYCENCPNKLGAEPACRRFQWVYGPMRINECLQCDECHSGPVFTRLAGGCRKAYGLKSAFNRPIPNIKHNYFD